jgi:Kef-type K+ transport system membrane component KefB
MNVYWVAAVWMALALAASLISIRTGVAVALVEIVVGAVVGNLPGHAHLVQQTAFTSFLATLGSAVLTFLAGAEIDPISLRRHWKPSLTIGAVSFAVPFAAAMAFTYVVLGWDLHAAEIGGTALSTTSVAVVYAVMIETGLNRTDLGKLILAACFITDLGTVLALGVLFAQFNWLLLTFVAVTAVSLWFLPRFTRAFFRRVAGRVSEPEIKFLFLVLFGLGGLASAADSEAVLPAYLVGLVVAGIFLRDRVVVDRMRAISFALLTPFFFLRAGLLIDAKALLAGAGVIVVLLVVKLAAKFIAVWPASGVFGMPRREKIYTTLLMATGLTFGSIAALYGLTNHLITQAQYSQLVTVVILSAFVPTLIAQQFFRPDITALEGMDQSLEEALSAEDVVLDGHHPHGPVPGRTGTDAAPSDYHQADLGADPGPDGARRRHSSQARGGDREQDRKGGG